MSQTERNLRLIARLDVKQEWLIKGVQMEGWRKVGDPAAAAASYSVDGADELILMDIVASLYGRNNLSNIVESVASEVFIPLTVGGGIRSTSDVGEMLARGADKIAINTAATRNPKLITEIADAYGSQATVVSIEAIRTSAGHWEAMTDNGRNPTGLEVVDWARQAEQHGAGEILLTSIDRDGSGQGFDLELIQRVCAAVSVPVIASGGLGQVDQLGDLITQTDASAAAVASAAHWKKLSFGDLREGLADHDCFVRPLRW